MEQQCRAQIVIEGEWIASGYTEHCFNKSMSPEISTEDEKWKASVF